MLRNVATHHHDSGTCKMGPASDPVPVVDQYRRVHGVKGLREVDASVMPDVIRDNTNVPTIMIAERVADWMKGGHEGGCNHRHARRRLEEGLSAT